MNLIESVILGVIARNEKTEPEYAAMLRAELNALRGGRVGVLEQAKRALERVLPQAQGALVIADIRDAIAAIGEAGNDYERGWATGYSQGVDMERMRVRDRGKSVFPDVIRALTAKGEHDRANALREITGVWVDEG